MKTNVVLMVTVSFDADAIAGISDAVIADATSVAVMRGLTADGFRPWTAEARPKIREHNVIDGPVTTSPRTAGQ